MLFFYEVSLSHEFGPEARLGNKILVKLELWELDNSI